MLKQPPMSTLKSFLHQQQVLFLFILVGLLSQSIHVNAFVVAPAVTSKIRSTVPLYAKPKKPAPVPQQQATGELPANLKRKVDAKRPTLGHVVPKAVRSNTGGSANPKLRPQGKAREAGLNNPSLLKILGGTQRGRRLDSPQVFLRPMMGKVKEAVYSTFTSFGMYDEGTMTTHLDIFTGSGSVGLESLSRGAKQCVFVDLSDDCCAAVRRNLEWCQFNIPDEGQEQGQVICADALQALRDPASVGISTSKPFSIVTLCPPYEEVVYADLIDAVANSPVVGEDTIVLLEYPVELEMLPHVIRRNDGGALVGIRNRRYGRTVIAMYICNPSGRMEVASSRPEEFV